MAYGISSIDMNPFANPMMSMMGGYGGMYGMNGMSPYGYGGMGMMGMMGMMNPQYIEQMAEVQKKIAEIQNQAEVQQMNHAVDNHELLVQSEIQNMSVHDRAFFQKAMVDGDINQGIKSLASVIRKGDSDAICEQYDKLKQNIYAKYGDEFIQNGIIGDERKVLDYIEKLYNIIITKQNGGEIADLKNDIKVYGETSFGHGFNKAFFGSDDYHNKYTEEVADYIYGEGIDNKHGKDKMHSVGSFTGSTLRYGIAGLVGFGGGYGIGKILERTISKMPAGAGGKYGKWLGALAGLIGAYVWQNT